MGRRIGAAIHIDKRRSAESKRAKELRAKGYKYNEIGVVLGLDTSWAWRLVNCYNSETGKKEGKIRVREELRVHGKPGERNPEIKCGVRERGHGGSVYFVQHNSGPIKIGVAIDIERRVDELQIANPFPVFLLGSIWFDEVREAYRCERELHFKFKDCRVRGEWFEPSESLVAYMSENGISGVLT
jgi:hypothetical protein